MRRRALLSGLIAPWALALPRVQAQVVGTGGEDLPRLIEQARTSVLLVGTYGELDAPRFGFRGTGFVVGGGNLAVTNAHVLPGPEEDVRGRRLQVQTLPHRGGKWEPREVNVVAIDRSKDLAVLRFEGPPVKPLDLAADGLAREGMSIALMGFPIGGSLGFSLVTHRGIVSSITPMVLPQRASQSLSERSIRALRDGAFDILQLDATAYPGNSGGPVFDLASGTVIGILNMVLVKGTRESALSQPSGISYAIPVSALRELIRRSGEPGSH
jgi:S1-C subfamily serine protease